MILMNLKIKTQFSKKDFPKNYIPAKFRRPPVDGFIDQLIQGKETVLDTSSASLTITRLKHLENKFKKSVEFHETYKNTLKSYINEGHVSKLSLEELKQLHLTQIIFLITA